MPDESTETYIQLERLFIANSDFEQLESELDVFCPFEAIGMVRQEIRHAHFLSYILDPNRPHGLGTECIKALMTVFSRVLVAGDVETAELSPLDVHLMGFQAATVRREWERIDLIIEVPETRIIIAVELKIDAVEHGQQLSRYREKVLDHWRADDWTHYFLFLTKRGEDPSELDGTGWLPVPLSDYVFELEHLVSKQVGNQDARTLLSFYVSMLRRHHLKNEKLEALASRLWAQHYDALSYLMDRRPDRFRDIQQRLFDRTGEIAKAISAATKFKIVADDSAPSLLRFGVEDWDDIADFRKAQWTASGRFLLIEVETGRAADFPVRLRFVLGRGDQGQRLKIFNALASEGTFKLGRRKSLSNEWSRLTSKTFKRYSEDDQRDDEEICKEIEAGIVKYAKDTVPLYAQALDRLRQQAIA